MTRRSNAFAHPGHRGMSALFKAVMLASGGALFQHPFDGWARPFNLAWTLKQVRGDGR